MHLTTGATPVFWYPGLQVHVTAKVVFSWEQTALVSQPPLFTLQLSEMTKMDRCQRPTITNLLTYQHTGPLVQLQCLCSRSYMYNGQRRFYLHENRSHLSHNHHFSLCNYLYMELMKSKSNRWAIVTRTLASNDRGDSDIGISCFANTLHSKCLRIMTAFCISITSTILDFATI